MLDQTEDTMTTRSARLCNVNGSPKAPWCGRFIVAATMCSMLVLLVAACSAERITKPPSWTCEATRPALNGTWVGTLDSQEIILQLVEGGCTGSLTPPAYVGWPISGTWSWKGISGQISGGGPSAGSLPQAYDPTAKLTYSVTLIRGFDGNVILGLDNLPAGSTITAQVSGIWTTPPTPPTGPLVLQRR
jgi:hypothetical protein